MPAPQPASSSLFAQGRLRVLLFCWLGWVFDFYDLILFSFCKRSIAADLGLDLFSSVAWIEGWSLLATALGAAWFGRLADRVSRRMAMTASIAVFSLGALATGLADDFGSLLAARVLAGLGVGGEWGIGHAVVADVWQGKQRDRVHGLLQAGSPVAMMLAAVVGCWLAPVVGWRSVFAASALLGLLAFAGRWCMPNSVQRVPTRDAIAPRSLLALLAPAYRRTTLVLLLILTLHMAGFWCVYAELPNALMQQHGVQPAAVGWFQLQVNAVHVVADVLFGFLAARFGRKRMFVLFCLLFALGQWLALRQLDAVSSDFRTFTWSIAAMGLGAGTWSCFGALFGAHYPMALRATAAALCYSLARSVQLPLKPAVNAAIAGLGSMAPALWLGIGCALGSAALVALLPRRGAFAEQGHEQDQDRRRP